MMNLSHQSAGAIKALARGQLLSNYMLACMVCLFVGASNLILTLLGGFVADQGSLAGLFLFEFFLLLKDVVLAVLEVGECLIFLKLALARKCSFKELFHGFSAHQDKIIRVALFMSIVENLFLIPAAFSVFSPLGLYLFYPLYFLGRIGAYIFRLVYSQVYYLLLDFPSRSWKELLRMSRMKMRGAKGRLFVLYLSFIPMMLLAILSFGIGAIWVIPYQRSAEANFFLDLMQRHGDGSSV